MLSQRAVRTMSKRFGMVAVMLGAGSISAVVFLTISNPGLHRPILASVFLGVLLIIAIQRPQAAVLMAFAFLAFLGIIRRLLIPVAGWSSFDPLLLFAPVFSIFLLASLYLGG